MSRARLSVFLFALLVIGAAVAGGYLLATWQAPRDERVTTAPAGKSPAPETTEPERPVYTEISLKSQDRRIPVLMYHEVIPVRTARSNWYDCSVSEFEEQMQFLADQGAVPISIQDLYDHLTTGKPVPEKAVVITFDDNYQGFYDNAWPILKRYNFPAAMFVHTGFVGRQDGAYPKMTWETLQELVKDPLFTVGGHTISHPDDLSKLPIAQQEKELTESKRELEERLGVKVDFFAYPNGKYDETTAELTKAAGYKMAFTIDNGLAEESPGIFKINRYVHTRLKRAWEERDTALRGGALGIARATVVDAPITYERIDEGRVKLSLIRGGLPETVQSDYRESVAEFVLRTGAQAGINGTFFAMAAIKSDDNRLVGPCKTREMTAVLGDEERSRWPKLRNRPVVMWGPSGLAILPFIPETMRTDEAFRHFMPDVTDVFMGGAWLVRDGRALSRDDMNIFASKDIQDARRRAFVGVDKEGRFVMGASRRSMTSAGLAEAIAEAGIVEAVLLDSGYSTSLVLGPHTLASGHATESKASRPVPHAIVVRGTVAPEVEQAAAGDALRVPKPEGF